MRAITFTGLLMLAGAAMAAPLPFQRPEPMKVVFIESPNQSLRRPGSPIDTIVLHHTASADLESVVRWFSSPESKVSAHFTVGRDGSIVQHVSTWMRAWHAGVSEDYFGRKSVNDFSVGIEIVNIGDGTQDYTPEQLEAVENLVAVLVQRHPITQITSHQYIARPFGRKNDPINFPWEKMAVFGLPVIR